MGESDGEEGEKWADSVISVFVCMLYTSHYLTLSLYVFWEVSKLATGNYILSDPLTWDSVPGLEKIKADLNGRIDEDRSMQYSC